jgi:hypothetical protein
MPCNLIRSAVLIILFCTTALAATVAQPKGRVVHRFSRISVEKQLLTVDEEVLVQVDNNEAGFLGKIAIPYSPDEKFEILEAVILNQQGAVVRSLSKKEITTRSYFSSDTYFADKLVKEFNLHWNEYPYQVRYRFQWVKSQFVSVANWSPRIYSNVRTQKAILQVSLPADYPVTFSAASEFTYTKKINEKNILHTWQAEDLEPVRREFMAPPLEDVLPQVKITPVQMVYGVTGSFASWSTLGNWQTELIKGLDELTLSEQIKVTALLKGVSDPAEKIRILYHHLQDNIRYVNVDIDIGGLKPYAASYVCDKKYGDCKALTIYMKALLKFAGIPSFYTLVHAGQTVTPIDTEHPGQQFNHVILCVPMGKDTVWLENTARYLPYNYLGTFTQNRHALLVDGINSRLINITAMKPTDVEEHMVSQLTIDQQGNGEVKATYRLRGRKFEQFRYLISEGSTEDQKEQVAALTPFINYQNLSWTIASQERDARELTIQLSMDISRHIRKLGQTLVVKPPPAKLFDQELDRPDSRKQPFRLDFPLYRTDSLIYTLSFLERFQAELPAAAAIHTAYGSFTESYTLDHATSRIIVHRQLLIKPGVYPVTEYAGFFAFIEQIKRHHQQANLVFHPKT